MTSFFKRSDPVATALVTALSADDKREAEPWRKLHQYWVSKHKDGRPPARRDLDPLLEIPQLVANLILLDLLDGGYRYRLIGSTNIERLGVDLTGQRVGQSGLAPNASSAWIELYDAIQGDRLPRMAVSRMASGHKAKHILVAMPLIDARDKIEGILAGAFYEGDFKQGTKIEGLMTHEIPL